MKKAKVLAIPAVESAHNFAYKLIDFMYGSEERVKITFAFSILLLAMGIMTSNYDTSSISVCPL